MAFSENWETTYSNREGWSVWPWSSLVSLVGRYCKPGKQVLNVLELGCGAGANIPYFKALNFNYYSVEGSPSVVTHLHERFPDLRSNIRCGDFTKEIPFEQRFDLIFDRASLTHNISADIHHSVRMVEGALVSGGLYIGVDWFSSTDSYAKLGTGHRLDSATREHFETGPYKGIEPVRFSSKEEIEVAFSGFHFLYLEETTHRIFLPENAGSLASWQFVAKKKG